MQKSLLIFLTVLVQTSVVPASTLMAQDIPIRYQYQKRGDRWEGIKSGHDVAGERLELISATFTPDMDSTSISPSRASLGFYLDSPENVRITLRLPEKNYWMEPINSSGSKNLSFNPGFKRISWDNATISFMEKRVQDLYAIAIVSSVDEGKRTLPVLLWQENLQLPQGLRIQMYEFAFQPNADVGILFQVKDENGNTVMSEDLEDMTADMPFTIRWRPGNAVEGEYNIDITASFPVTGGVSKKQKYNFKFHHNSLISTSD